MYTNTHFFIFILCLNTITSMINTNVFFDFTDFQAEKLPGDERNSVLQQAVRDVFVVHVGGTRLCNLEY